LPAAAVLAELGSGPDGLGAAEADRRLAEAGANELPSASGPGWPGILARQFRSILILILLIAAALALVLGEPVEAAAILIIVLLSVVLGFVQEFRAEKALDALGRLAAPRARVVREGRQAECPARELVPGDVVVVAAGDRIPADGRLIESFNLRLDEAALTGESVSEDKDHEVLEPSDAPVGDRRNMVFSGTIATQGRGRAVVTATGQATEFGAIGRLLAGVEKRRTPLQRNLDRLGRALASAALAVVVLIVMAGLFRGTDLLELFLFGVALAVAVVPEALPAVVTVSLAIGVQRMARRNALIRHLPAVETLGSTSVICTDKTGTLTRNEMTVTEIFADGQRIGVTGLGYSDKGTLQFEKRGHAPDEALHRLLATAVLASDATVVVENEGPRVVGDPTEGALVVAASKAGLDPDALRERCPRLAELPFDAATRRMVTLHAAPDGPLAHLKGAPEAVLPLCSGYAGSAGVRPLTPADRQAVEDAASDMAGRALRVMAFACRRGTETDAEAGGFEFLGLTGMLDPPRETAASAVRRCRRAGVRPVMVTGDHPQTARAIAAEVGILSGGAVVTGTDLAGWPADSLAERVTGIDVFSRVSPEQKLQVIDAWQGRRGVVAMTGDGVNDAPALRKADVGVAMGLTGTDVSREAADMILTDDRFESIVGAVEEGRGIFSNIRKYLMYLLSSNVGEIGLIGAATLAGLPMPLTAVQILYVNLATDGLPALALAVDPPADDLMERPPRDPDAGVFDMATIMLLLTGGFWSAGANLGLFAWALGSGRTPAEAMTMTFVSLVLIQFFKAYCFRSERGSILHRPFANHWLNLAIAWEMLLLAVIVYWPVLRGAFGTFPLTAADWLLVLTVAFSVVPVLEAAKYVLRHREPLEAQGKAA
jgi:Ca2+-transporting ATPase